MVPYLYVLYRLVSNLYPYSLSVFSISTSFLLYPLHLCIVHRSERVWEWEQKIWKVDWQICNFLLQTFFHFYLWKCLKASKRKKMLFASQKLFRQKFCDDPQSLASLSLSNAFSEAYDAGIFRLQKSHFFRCADNTLNCSAGPCPSSTQEPRALKKRRSLI